MCVGSNLSVSRAELPDHLIGSVSGDRLGKSSWALKENLHKALTQLFCIHGASKNIPLRAWFLVPFLLSLKALKAIQRIWVIKIRHDKAAYGVEDHGWLFKLHKSAPFQASLLRIAAAAMDSTVKVPPQTWNLGKCITVPLWERCWKMHKKGERRE